MVIDCRAEDAFKENMKDVHRLLAIHADLSGDKPGRKRGVEVLNESAVILVTACWEAFCEDVCRAAVEFLLTTTTTSSQFPSDARWSLARLLHKDKDERRLWSLADSGWKQEVRRYSEEVLSKLNSPKSCNVDRVFGSTLGMPRISAHWRWSGMSAARARAKLDSFIELRGSLAHRAKAAQAVYKGTVIEYVNHVSKLVEYTFFAIAFYLRGVLGFEATRTVRL